MTNDPNFYCWDLVPIQDWYFTSYDIFNASSKQWLMTFLNSAQTSNCVMVCLLKTDDKRGFDLIQRRLHRNPSSHLNSATPLLHTRSRKPGSRSIQSRPLSAAFQSVTLPPCARYKKNHLKTKKKKKYITKKKQGPLF